MRPPPPAEAGIVETARAKLNLDLILTGRRPDGYHELDSIVAFADLGDRLAFEPADGLWIECRGPLAAEVPGGDGNIVRRAALRLAEAVGRDPGVLIRLEKRLPVAAGIGGGSADAAATLRGLARLWHLRADAPELIRVAEGLGSDVPVCLGSRPARMRGIGELIEPLPGLPPLHLVLVNPGRPLSTAAVFARVGPELFGERHEPVPSPPDLAWLRRSRNDLEPPARALLPVIGRLLAALEARPGCLLARMSGSGPTCFGVFEGAAAAEEAASALAGAHPGWWSTPCRLAGPPA